jgi:hypothetical protein
VSMMIVFSFASNCGHGTAGATAPMQPRAADSESEGV